MNQKETRDGFIATGIPSELVNELLDSFGEIKSRFFRNDLRPNAVEGGRFSEAAFRILQWALASGKYTPVGKSLPKVDVLLTNFANFSGSDSLRLHVPRALRMIYDIRNKRDAVHLGDGIDPNVQDASLVVRVAEWVLAELVRLYHSVSPEDAHRIIADLVAKEVPVIQVFEGFPRVLRDLKATDYCLVLLYWRGAQGAELRELAAWVRPPMRAHLRRTLAGMEEKHLVHFTDERVTLTALGERLVESRRLVEPT